MFTRTVIDPWDSSTLSLTVRTEMVVELEERVTLRVPVSPEAANRPLWLTDSLMVIEEVGAGLAVSVNLAAPPSVIEPLPLTRTTGELGGGVAVGVGVGGGVGVYVGGGPSLSRTVTEAERSVLCRV